LIHTYHAVPLSCRSAKGLDCVFPLDSHIPCRSHAGMVCVNQTRPQYVNQMGRTQSKLLAERHGRGTAWYCESALSASHQCRDTAVFGLVILCASINTVGLATLMFQANKHPPLATSPHLAGPFAKTLTPAPAKNRALHDTCSSFVSHCNSVLIKT
jgi:hypothetical protein